MLSDVIFMIKDGVDWRADMNYRNGEECLHSTYEDMKGMTLEDAIYILSEPVKKYHKAKTDSERINLPRPRLIRAYELVIEAIKG